MARAGWSQAPDEDAADDVSRGAGAARRAPATSSTRSRTSPGPAAARGTTSSTGRTASGSASAAARIRRGTAPAGATFLLPWSTSAASERGESSVAERRVLDADERLEDALFTGLRLTDGSRSAGHRGALRRRCLGPLRRRAGALRRRRVCWSTSPERRLALDTVRNAAGQRGHDGFHRPDSTVK